MRKIIAVLIFISFFSCGKNEVRNHFDIDLSIKTLREIKSIRIYKNKVLYYKISQHQALNLYQFDMNESQIKKIDHVLNTIDFSNCDTIKNEIIHDYECYCIIKQSNKVHKIIGGTCSQFDKLVNELNNMCENKKDKELVFNSLEILTPKETYRDYLNEK